MAQIGPVRGQGFGDDVEAARSLLVAVSHGMHAAALGERCRPRDEHAIAGP